MIDGQAWMGLPVDYPTPGHAYGEMAFMHSLWSPSRTFKLHQLDKSLPIISFLEG